MANIFNEYFINIANDLPRPEQSQYGLKFNGHPSIRGINNFMSKHHDIMGLLLNPVILLLLKIPSFHCPRLKPWAGTIFP